MQWDTTSQVYNAAWNIQALLHASSIPPFTLCTFVVWHFLPLISFTCDNLGPSMNDVTQFLTPSPIVTHLSTIVTKSLTSSLLRPWRRLWMTPYYMTYLKPSSFVLHKHTFNFKILCVLVEIQSHYQIIRAVLKDAYCIKKTVEQKHYIAFLIVLFICSLFN